MQILHIYIIYIISVVEHCTGNIVAQPCCIILIDSLPNICTYLTVGKIFAPALHPSLPLIQESTQSFIATAFYIHCMHACTHKHPPALSLEFYR